MSVHQLKDGRWYVVFWVNRKQKRRYFGRGKDAETRAKAFNKACHPTRNAGGVTVAELVNHWLAAKIGSVAKATMKNWVYKFSRVILPAIGHHPAEALTINHLDKYVAQRLQKVKRSTVHTELTAIKAMLNWAVSRGHLTKNPVAGYRKPKPDYEIITPPRPDEIQRIIDNAAPHLVRAILLAYFTGLRPGVVELFNLKYSNCDFEQNTIMIRSAKKGGIPFRIIPLHPTLAALIRQWFKEDGENEDGFIIHYFRKKVSTIKTAWDMAKKRAGITRRLRLYDLRHAGITAMLQHGIDIKTVSAIAGHSNVSTTLRVYAHTNNTVARTAINAIPNVGQGLINTTKKKNPHKPNKNKA